MAGKTALALLCSACAPQGAQDAAGPLSCRIEAEETGELGAQDICAIFEPLLSGKPGAHIEIVMPKAYIAKVRVLDADDRVLAEAGASSSDRALGRSAWQAAARELERQLSIAGNL